MDLRYLLDTNVVSELVKQQPDFGVVGAVSAHEAACAISAPTLEELVFGCERLLSADRRQWLRRWIDGLTQRWPVLPYDGRAAHWLGQERARLAAAGRPAPRADGEIAAIAVVHGLTLVTRNLRDFSGFQGLATADWHRSLPPG